MHILYSLVVLLSLWLLSACSTLTPDGARVRLTSNPEVVRGCTFVGNVKAASGWNGMMTGNLGPEQVDTKLRNQTAAQGGNVLYLVQSASFMTARGSGEAYRCP